MTIIFDFNRTIYDPEQGTAMPGALELLRALKAAGHNLFLVSKLEAGREDALKTLGMSSFFAETFFVEEKGETLKKIIHASPTPVYVVGDYLYEEVRIGNELGARTIWLRAGKFKDLTPQGARDVPWRTIAHLQEVLPLIS